MLMKRDPVPRGSPMEVCWRERDHGWPVVLPFPSSSECASKGSTQRGASKGDDHPGSIKNGAIIWAKGTIPGGTKKKIEKRMEASSLDGTYQAAGSRGFREVFPSK